MADLLDLPLGRSSIDRDYLTRNRLDLFDELSIDPNARVLAINNGNVLLESSGADVIPQLRLLTPGQIPNSELRVYLGKTTEAQNGEPAGLMVYLAQVSDTVAAEIEPDANQWRHLRATGAGLGPRDAGLFTLGLAISNWHDAHQFCSRCGGSTIVEKSGWVRRCLKDGQELFPRTDPAIIASVIDSQDRILLGSQGAWEQNRWSILAGFVEPGESLSAAVIREIYEEAGVRVIDPHYLGSQTWPFPYSLMVGFTVRVDPEFEHLGVTPDGDEIVRLRWFSRDEIKAEAGSLLLPDRLSISRAIIEHWYGGRIE
jgi:NAD+ diphosphatase